MVKMRVYIGETFQRSIDENVSYLMPATVCVLLQRDYDSPRAV